MTKFTSLGGKHKARTGKIKTSKKNNQISFSRMQIQA